jgi:hypothetical protein
VFSSDAVIPSKPTKEHGFVLGVIRGVAGHCMRGLCSLDLLGPLGFNYS